MKQRGKKENKKEGDRAARKTKYESKLTMGCASTFCTFDMLIRLSTREKNVKKNEVNSENLESRRACASSLLALE